MPQLFYFAAERQWKIMNRNDFIAKANEWIRGATGGALGFSDNDLFIIQKHSQQYIFNNGMQKSNRLRAAFCDMLLLRRGLIVIPGWAYCIKNVWL